MREGCENRVVHTASKMARGASGMNVTAERGGLITTAGRGRSRRGKRNHPTGNAIGFVLASCAAPAPRSPFPCGEGSRGSVGSPHPPAAPVPPPRDGEGAPPEGPGKCRSEARCRGLRAIPPQGGRGTARSAVGGAVAHHPPSRRKRKGADREVHDYPSSVVRAPLLDLRGGLRCGPLVQEASLLCSLRVSPHAIVTHKGEHA